MAACIHKSCLHRLAVGGGARSFVEWGAEEPIDAIALSLHRIFHCLLHPHSVSGGISSLLEMRAEVAGKEGWWVVDGRGV